MSLAAQAATLPLVLFHFGRLSLVSPVANLVMAPIVAPAMLVASLCLVAGLVVGLGVPALVAAPLRVLGWVVLGAMVAVAGTSRRAPVRERRAPVDRRDLWLRPRSGLVVLVVRRGDRAVPPVMAHPPRRSRPARRPAPAGAASNGDRRRRRRV